MKEVFKEILSTVLYLLVIFVLTFLFITFIAQRTEVSGSSMEPTPYKYGDKQYFIKRVIGLPGETVRIDGDGNIYINGAILQESYGAEVIIDPGVASTEITLGEGEFFVMGDNRNHSMDSRDPSVGNISKKDILGRAFIRIYPFSKFGGVE